MSTFEEREMARLRKHGLVPPTASELANDTASDKSQTPTATSKLEKNKVSTTTTKPAPKKVERQHTYEDFQGGSPSEMAKSEEARLRRHGLGSAMTASGKSKNEGSSPSSNMESTGEPRWPKSAGVKREYELAVFVELNKVRQDPAGYAAKLETLRGSFREDGAFRVPNTRIAMETREGVAAVDEAIAFLKTQAKPVQLLKLSDELSLAACDLVADNGAKGLNGAQMSDGTGAKERILKRCQPSGQLAENIAIGPFEAELVVSHWLVDDGLKDRPHRRTILDQNMRYVGISGGPHSKMHVMCVASMVQTLTGDASVGSGVAAPASRAAPTVVRQPTQHSSGKLEETADRSAFMVNSIPLHVPLTALTLWKRPGRELHLQKVTTKDNGDSLVENFRWKMPIPFGTNDVSATYNAHDTVVSVTIRKAKETDGVAKQVATFKLPSKPDAGEDVELVTNQSSEAWILSCAPSRYNEDVVVKMDGRTLSFEFNHSVPSPKGKMNIKGTQTLTLPIAPASDAVSLLSCDASGAKVQVLKKAREVEEDSEPVQLPIDVAASSGSNSPARAVSPGSTPTPARSFCVKCGNKLGVGDSFCGSCGVKNA